MIWDRRAKTARAALRAWPGGGLVFCWAILVALACSQAEHDPQDDESADATAAEGAPDATHDVTMTSEDEWAVQRSAASPHEYVSLMSLDLGVEAQFFPPEGVRVLVRSNSVGRFPAGVSIVRVAPFLSEDGISRRLDVEPMAVDRSVYWNHVFDDLPPVREVTILRTLGIDPRGGMHTDFLRESLNVDCDLCLIYAWVDDTEADGEFDAVLWDAKEKRPLATYRVPVYLPSEVKVKCEKHKHSPKRLCAAEYMAEAELRRLVRDTMWDLVAHDGPSPTTQPSPWRTDEMWWPRDFEYWRARQPSRLRVP